MKTSAAVREESVSDARRSEQHGALTSPGTWVGRSFEFERLQRLTATGRAGIRLVLGECGIGKTRLVEEVLASLDPSWRRVRGRAGECDDEEFALWSSPLRHLGVRLPDAKMLPAAERRWVVLDSLVESLSTSVETVVFLDDLQWADESSLWVLEHVLDCVGSWPVMVIGAARTRDDYAGGRWSALYRRAEVIILDGLNEREIELLAEGLGCTSVNAANLLALTGGNPLLIREVLCGGASTSQIDELLSAAMARAGDGVAELIAAVTLSGGDTPGEVLAAGLGCSIREVDALLARALRHGLLVRRDSVPVARHGLLAGFAVRRLSEGHRRRLHARLSAAWQLRTGCRALRAAAEHALAALPCTDVDTTVDLVRRAASAARNAGLIASEAGLLASARTALNETGVERHVVARLALDEAMARWELDEPEAAVAAAEAGLRLAGDDVILVAEAETLALWHYNPYMADPVRLARLEELDAMLPETADPALRVRLRGRRAVMSVAMPDRIDAAIALGDDAVRRARALADPKVLIDAFRDRYFVLRTPGDIDAREAAASEIIDIASRRGHPQLAMLGWEWAFAGHLGRGDTVGAMGALDRLAALCAVMGSPRWRYTADVHRADMLVLLGDPDGAVSLLVGATEAARVALYELERTGRALAFRAGIASLYGRPFIDAAHLVDEFRAAVGDASMICAQGLLTYYELLLGDDIAARHRIAPWVGRFSDALRGPESLGVLTILAEIVVRLGLTSAVDEIVGLLTPFTGRLTTGLSLPNDTHLANLHLLRGDMIAARALAEEAVALARRSGLHALIPGCLATLAEATAVGGDRAGAVSARDAAEAAAERLGIVLRPSIVISSGRGGSNSKVVIEFTAKTAAVRFTGSVWTIISPFGELYLPDSGGLQQLIRLLITPGIEVRATELAGVGSGNGAVRNVDLGPLLDARAKNCYRRRINELRANIDAADADNDIERVACYRVELDSLLDELRNAVGLGGRDRPQQSGAERARVNVTRNIRRAIAAISREQPDLGAHLQNSVHTGYGCVYAPEPAARICWTVERSS